MPEIGEVYVDKDPRAAFRTLHVVAVVNRNEYPVNRDYALCVSRGKAFTVSVNRLVDKTRFTKSIDHQDTGKS